MKNKSFWILFTKVIILELISVFFIGLLLFTFFLIYSIPLQKQGINNEPLSFNVQPYLLENELDLYLNENFSKAHDIYSKYNFTFTLLEPIILNITIDENERERILKQNCTLIGNLYNLTDYKNEKTIKLIFLKFNKTDNGMGYICNKSNLAIISLNNSKSGWVLAHEFGHILGAEKECWKFNLMKEYSKECPEINCLTHNFIRNLQPDLLFQKQVNAISNSIKKRFT